ncbi:hypothetical protein AU192_08280 [Mycobacterium lehmannii]|uniref:Uncharacterized protein n=1 Tax=Mycobacterium lehmannii TaxID=2048550 RepID=A0A124ENA3_9MYCO|nr:hypothetical protein AU192_08280 [Mycobacterium lehmannii]
MIERQPTGEAGVLELVGIEVQIVAGEPFRHRFGIDERSRQPRPVGQTERPIAQRHDRILGYPAGRNRGSRFSGDRVDEAQEPPLTKSFKRAFDATPAELRRAPSSA